MGMTFRDSESDRSAHKHLPDLLGESEAYLVDTRGDAKNLEYGYLHRYDIPQYARRGQGRVLGVNDHNRIDQSQDNTKQISISNERSGDRGQAQARVLASRKGPRRGLGVHTILSSGNFDLSELSQDTITFIEDDGEIAEVDDDAEAFLMVPDYRSLSYQNNRKMSSKLSHISALSDPCDRSHSQDSGSSHRQQIANASVAVKRDPRNVAGWLDLCELQIHLIRSGASEKDLMSTERRTLAELRVSILLEAVKAIDQATHDCELVHLALLHEGSFIWTDAKLTSRWLETVTEFNLSIRIWVEYFDYVQCHSREFQYEKCKATFVQCLDLLQRQEPNDVKDHEHASIVRTYVFLRLTAFMHDAGYCEHAIAMWQAAIELTFFTSTSTSSEAFSNFWDNERLRIGEEGARGWSNCDTQSTRVQPTSRTARDGSHSREMSIFESLKREHDGTEDFRLPSSLNDDVESEDPYSCIMFSDMEDVIRPVLSRIVPLHLVYGLLRWLSLPPLQDEMSQDIRAWWQDPYLCRNNTSTEAHSDTTSEALTGLRQQNHLETIDTLFTTAFKHRNPKFSADEARFVDRVLGQLVHIDSVPIILREYYLAFKFHCFPLECRKAARACLKRHPSSLPLYDALAWIEVSSGNTAKAVQIWDTTSKMQSNLLLTSSDDMVRIRHSAAGALLLHHEETTALHYLVHGSASLEHIPGVRHPVREQDMALCEQSLQAGFQRTLHAGKPALAVLYADCLAMFAYLASEKDINTAISAYDNYAKLLLARSDLIHVETLTQSKARTIGLHLYARRPFRPAELSDSIAKDLSQFPHNSILLEISARLAGQDRLRLLLSQQKSHTEVLSIVQWSSRLAEELFRRNSNSAGSTIHSVRKLFTDICDAKDKISRSSLFWYAWLDFEISLNDWQRAKMVMLDGLQCIPWAKNFPLEAIVRLAPKSVLSETELRQVALTMIDHGLRFTCDVLG